MVLLPAVCLYLILLAFDAFEAFYDFSRAHESYELDELALLVPAVLVGLIILSAKLQRDIAKQNKNLEIIVNEKTEHLLRTIKKQDALILERETLLDEINHRVKNNLQLVGNLLYLSSMEMRDPADKSIIEDLRDKVHSIGTVHKLLYSEEILDHIRFKAFAEELLTHLVHTHSSDRVEVALDVEDFTLDLKHSVPIGLILNELISNAFKHVADLGKLDISARPDRNDILLIFRDDGPGLDPDFDPDQTNSMGLRLIKDLVEVQLRGSIKFESANGTKVTVRFPYSVPGDFAMQRRSLDARS